MGRRAAEFRRPIRRKLSYGICFLLGAFSVVGLVMVFVQHNYHQDRVQHTLMVTLHSPFLFFVFFILLMIFLVFDWWFLIGDVIMVLNCINLNIVANATAIVVVISLQTPLKPLCRAFNYCCRLQFRTIDVMLYVMVLQDNLFLFLQDYFLYFF